jgi:allantoate deiminase
MLDAILSDGLIAVARADGQKWRKSMENFIQQPASSDDTLIRIFTNQVANMLEWLAQFGGESNGGVTRLLYTPAWRQAQWALAKRMRLNGLTPYFDDAGNLFGRLEGTEVGSSGSILTGSHIDTVVQGGRYDGTYGIAAGILALAYLKETYGQPRRTIEVVSFAEEEGSRFPVTFWGSGNVTGLYSTLHPPAICDAEGVTLVDAMNQVGFGLNHYDAAGRSDWDAFIELHIEQGSVLDREQYSIGIVRGIVGQRRYTFEVNGEANHAGTTPMSYRKDALCGASEMILAIRNAALSHGDGLVATVGRLEAEPGMSNAVPGQVTFTLDARHSREEELNGFCESLIQKLEHIAESAGLSFSSHLWMQAAPVLMDEQLTDLLQSSSSSRGFSSLNMFSGAGHDAQLLASVCPTAMVFVPSRNGISHSPVEFTEPEELAAGIVVLTDLLYALAYKGENL